MAFCGLLHGNITLLRRNAIQRLSLRQKLTSDIPIPGLSRDNYSTQNDFSMKNWSFLATSKLKTYFMMRQVFDSPSIDVNNFISFL